jgi:hypothetical protein
MKYKPVKIKNRYFIERSKEPEGLNTHILFYESETLSGVCIKRVFKGTYQECRKEKEERENVSKRRNFRLFKKIFND